MFRYLIAFTVPLLGYFSLVSDGWLTYTLVFYLLGLVPLLELVTGPKEKTDTSDPRKAWYYTLLLYLMVPIQYFLLYTYLQRISGHPSLVEMVGLTLSMSELCGITGINIGHELGHRKSQLSRFLAHALLLTSLYLHYHIEHNKGHHKRVATPDDPASAPRGMSLYRFWIRTVFGSLKSAWHIEATRLERKGLPRGDLNNRIIQYAIIEILFLGLIAYLFGWQALAGFVVAALLGILLLESVNYIEHYGLRRNQIRPGIYERDQPVHSWGCDYFLSRCLFFEVTTHPAHHRNSSIPYQDLISLRQAPDMPTGYSGMVILAMIPFLWFRVMDARIPADQVE